MVKHLIEPADNRIMAIDGQTSGELAWNHLTKTERHELLVALNELHSALNELDPIRS